MAGLPPTSRPGPSPTREGPRDSDTPVKDYLSDIQGDPRHPLVGPEPPAGPGLNQAAPGAPGAAPGAPPAPGPGGLPPPGRQAASWAAPAAGEIASDLYRALLETFFFKMLVRISFFGFFYYVLTYT